MECDCDQLYEIRPWYLEQYVLKPHELYDGIINGGGYVHAFIADSCIYPSSQISKEEPGFDSTCENHFKEYDSGSSLKFIHNKLPNKPKKGDVALYFKEKNLIHAAVYGANNGERDADCWNSKFGKAQIFCHDLENVPDHYGEVKFYLTWDQTATGKPEL